MKKNRIIIITILLVSFFTFGLVVKAQNTDKKAKYTRPLPQIAKQVEGTQVGGGARSTGNSGNSATGGTSEDIDLCKNPGVVKSAQIVGWCLFVIKIIAPILLIIFALIEIGKAVVANDDKAIQTAISSLVKRAIAAVVIFFVPTIIAFVFNVVASATEAKTKYSCLSSCINKPGSCKIPSNILFK